MNEPIIPPQPPGQPPDRDSETPDVEQPKGETTIDDQLVFEVEALAHTAASELAARIAHHVARAVGKLADEEKPDTIVFLDDELNAALALHDAFEAQCQSLEGAFRHAQNLADKALLSLRGGGTHARPQLAVIGALGGVASGVAAVANLVGYFRADTSFAGRSATVGTRAFVMELARFLSEQLSATQFQWPSYTTSLLAPASRWTPLARLSAVQAAADAADRAILQLADRISLLAPQDARILHARRALDQAYASDEGASALLSQILGDFLAPSEDGNRAPLQQLRLAAEVRELMGRDQAKVLFLRADVEAAGGSYRTKRSLWTTLFGAEGLAMTGGAVVSYSLLRPTGYFIDSATLRFRTASMPFNNQETDFVLPPISSGLRRRALGLYQSPLRISGGTHG